MLRETVRNKSRWIKITFLHRVSVDGFMLNFLHNLEGDSWPNVRYINKPTIIIQYLRSQKDDNAQSEFYVFFF